MISGGIVGEVPNRRMERAVVEEMSERENAGFNPEELKVIAEAFREAKVRVQRKRALKDGLETELAHYVINVAQNGGLEQQAIVARAVRYFTVLN